MTENGAHNRIVVCPGANHAMTVEEISWIKDEIKNYDMLMLQFELPMFINEAAARWAHEAPAIAGHPLRTTADGVDMDDLSAVSEIFAAKGVQNLIITLGGNGSVAAGKDGTAKVVEEGGPLNRALRNSVLAEMFVLQALSAILQADCGQTPEQYVRCHPGGKLGELREEEK